MSGIRPASEDELHAYVDGALDAGRHDEIAGILRADATLAARVANYARDQNALRQAVTSLSAGPMPVDWARRIDAATSRRRPSAPTRRYAIAASLALLVGGGATAWWWPRGDTILADALAIRDGTVGGGDAVSAGLLADAAARDKRIAAALGLPVRAPDLRRFGFQLAALEVFTHAVQLRYADSLHRDLTIYVRPSYGAVRFDMLRHGAQRICIWQDDVVGAVIVAPLSAGEMMRVASKAYGDLDL